VKAVNILVASVGGQGGLTLARVIAEAAVISGMSVRTGEILGMAQRYGSVVSYIRLGEKVLSPLFSEGEADYLLGLELFEAARNLSYLSPQGLAILADEYRPPLQASLSGKQYTKSELIAKIRSIVHNTIVVPARSIALSSAGTPRAINMVLLGVLNAKTNLFSEDAVVKAISEVLAGRAREASISAYRAGVLYAQQALRLPF
jgi:indolepyruvate ferredoxin oxidoreductase beta subunit